MQRLAQLSWLPCELCYISETRWWPSHIGKTDTKLTKNQTEYYITPSRQNCVGSWSVWSNCSSVTGYKYHDWTLDNAQWWRDKERKKWIVSVTPITPARQTEWLRICHLLFAIDFGVSLAVWLRYKCHERTTYNIDSEDKVGGMWTLDQ